MSESYRLGTSGRYALRSKMGCMFIYWKVYQKAED